MISGHDTVLVCGGDIRMQINRFLVERLRDWPELRASVSGESSGEFVPWSHCGLTLPLEGEILVARDEAMEAAWDEFGYEIGSDAEGPFAIYYQMVKQSVIPVTALADPYGRTEFQFESYELFLLGRGLWLVTLVTPDVELQFSRLLIRSFIDAAVVERW